MVLLFFKVITIQSVFCVAWYQQNFLSLHSQEHMPQMSDLGRGEMGEHKVVGVIVSSIIMFGRNCPQSESCIEMK